MSNLLASCHSLKAKLRDLMGDAGREISLFDTGDMPCGWPTVLSWEPWTAAEPHPWVSYALEVNEQLRAAVCALGDVRRELAAFGWGRSRKLREQFGIFFQCDVVAERWLDEIKYGESYSKCGSEGEPEPVYEIILVARPAPLAVLDQLVDFAERLAQDEERGGEERNEASERADTDVVTPAETPSAAAVVIAPRRIGRKKHAENPLWRPVIHQTIALRSDGHTWAVIARTLDKEFPGLKPFTAEQVRKIHDNNTDG